MLGRRSPLVFVSALFVFNNVCFAFEEFISHPGTRAMGMAGVFSPQADDSSAVWYNPAGLKRQEGVRSEVSIGLARTVSPANASGSVSYQENSPEITSFSAYLNAIPYSGRHLDKMAVGVAYIVPLSLRVDVDAARSPLDPQPFGPTDIKYRQLSAALSYAFSQSLTFGAVLDYVWSDVDCLAFSPCVNNGPTGFGLGLGLIHSVYHTQAYQLQWSLLWRARAQLKYSSTPSSGIGTVLEDYVPAKPQTSAVGVNLKIPSAWAFININAVAEHAGWSEAGGINANRGDYRNAGISAEFIMPIDERTALSARMGHKRSRTPDSVGLDNVESTAIGAGLAFMSHHAVDVAYEKRKADFSGNRQAKLVSLSYSVQF